jgi:hypothetical protein
MLDEPEDDLGFTFRDALIAALAVIVACTLLFVGMMWFIQL